MTLAQAQQKWVGLAYAKLAFNLQQCRFNQLCPAENVINNELCIRIVINDKTLLLHNGFPLAFNVVDDIDKCCRAIWWAKRHDSISPLGALKEELFLSG